jgi:CheY-like chemotaxis protein
VHSWGGAVRIQSVVGAGTTVEVLLPAAGRGADSLAAAWPAPVAAVPRGHVLVVDDDHAVADVMAERVRLLGATVTVALSADAALEAVRHADPPIGLVLADLAMPGHGGEWLARTLQQEAPHTPVVLMTGDRRQLTDSQAAAAGVTVVLDKPVDGDALATVLVATFGAVASNGAARAD